VEKRYPEMWANSAIKKLPQAKQLPNWRKIAQSGHPASARFLSAQFCFLCFTKPYFFFHSLLWSPPAIIFYVRKLVCITL
jgi:hypothetical protein